MKFAVDLVGESIAPYEVVGVFGELRELGYWNVQKAPLLERSGDYNIWCGRVTLPDIAVVRYRYFIAALDQRTQKLQLRRWETHAEARVYEINGRGHSCSDKFGWIDANKREVRRGWLNTGKVVLFKLSNNALKCDEEQNTNELLRLKLELVDPDLKLPIMPSPRAHVHYTSLKYGNSQLQEQSDHGVIYEAEQMLVFHTILMDFNKVVYLFKLYATDEQSGYVRLLGHQYISPQILSGSEGELSLTLVSPSWTNSVGTLKFRYLIISAMRDWRVRLNSTLIDYWPSSWRGLNVGYRGSGMISTSKYPVTSMEDTIGSMIKSYNAGVDMVHFTVQLTKDLVPVIYHEFRIFVCKKETPLCKEDLVPLHIKDVTYKQLTSLKMYKMVDEKIVEYPAPNTLNNECYQLFPTLERVYARIDKKLGFNIEIKWPQVLHDGSAEDFQTIDKNKFVDTILDVVKRFGWGRVCLFSSYDADMCTMLAYKQNMYPVLLVVPSVVPFYEDPRTHSLHAAVNTAQAFELAGIVQSVTLFNKLKDPVDIVRRQNKLLMLWGEVLSDEITSKKLKTDNVDAIISACVDLMPEKCKKNRFEVDKYLHRLFALQLNSNCY